ncbi:MAG TPA: ABC transporter permease [Methylomirabilota bacterium]|nr:ABC transporter permease [Methylomirabilota bacterium]
MKARALLWPLAVTLALLVAWEEVVRALRVKTVLLPRPSVIAGVLWSQGPLILEHMWPTFYQIVLGFLLSLAGGVLVAVLITYSEIVRKGFYPLIVVSQIVPKVAVAPLFVVWFGLGDLSRLLLAFLIAFFPIVINTAAGLTSVDDDYVRMARAYMGSRGQIFTKIRLPHALPLIFGGMKISITLAVIGVVVAEFVAAQRGIGYLIVMANGLLDTPLMMAAIVALSAMGLGLYGVVAGLERMVVYWQAPTETPRGGFA